MALSKIAFDVDIHSNGEDNEDILDYQDDQDNYSYISLQPDMENMDMENDNKDVDANIIVENPNFNENFDNVHQKMQRVNIADDIYSLDKDKKNSDVDIGNSNNSNNDMKKIINLINALYKKINNLESSITLLNSNNNKNNTNNNDKCKQRKVNYDSSRSKLMPYPYVQNNVRLLKLGNMDINNLGRLIGPNGSVVNELNRKYQVAVGVPKLEDAQNSPFVIISKKSKYSNMDQAQQEILYILSSGYIS